MMFKIIFLSVIFPVLVLADKAPAEKNLRLADRVLVYSILKDIFGGSEEELFLENILHQHQTFGGPCDVYEQVRIEGNNQGVADPKTWCACGRHVFSAQVIAKPNMLRYGRIAYVCQQLTQKNETMQNALKQVFGNKPVSSPNAKSLTKAYQLFNPEKKLDTQVFLEKLKVKSGDEENTLENWSKIFLVFCTDSSWQII